MKPMTLVFAALVSVGTAVAGNAPDFTLNDSAGTEHSLSQYKGKTVVLEWVNQGCPFVKKHYREGHMQKLQETYTGKDVIWLSITSSAPGKQGYKTPEQHEMAIAKQGIKATAVLIDSDGTVGKLYQAKTTPHMFVIDAEGNIAYQGAIDNKKSTKTADIAGSENFVRNALDEILAGKAVSVPKTQPYGCSVKY